MNIYEPNNRFSKYKTKTVGNTRKFAKSNFGGYLNIPLSEFNQSSVQK